MAAPVDAGLQFHVFRHWDVDHRTERDAVSLFRHEILVTTRFGPVLHAVIASGRVTQEWVGDTLAHVQLIEGGCFERSLVGGPQQKAFPRGVLDAHLRIVGGTKVAVLLETPGCLDSECVDPGHAVFLSDDRNHELNILGLTGTVACVGGATRCHNLVGHREAVAHI